MVYRIRASSFLIKRSVSGGPLVGGFRKYTPPQKSRQKGVASPAQYIGPGSLNMHLPELLRSDEHLQAIVYGQAAGGGAMFVATSQRILIVVKSVLTVRSEEVPLDMVSGLDLERQGALTLLTVYTNSDKHSIRTLDRAAARHFVEYVETCRETQHVKREMR